MDDLLREPVQRHPHNLVGVDVVSGILDKRALCASAFNSWIGENVASCRIRMIDGGSAA
jgi:hypothetical protein